MSDYHAHFEPLRRPTTLGRVLVLLAGSALWIAALVIVAWAAGETWLIWLGMVIAAASFVLWLVPLLLLRAERVREERKPEPSR
jgi:hypothetical protein